jgi:hypothetical protein
MAGKANWPTGAELGAYLQTLGVETPPGSPSLTDRMEAEVQRWESETGWNPFLAESAASVQTLVPSGMVWQDLNGGYVSVDAVRWAGRTLTPGEDYWLEPSGAPAHGRPYTWLQWGIPVQGRAPIEVEGRRGYGVTIPMDAWLAVLDRAAARVLISEQAQPGAWREVRQGSVTLKRGDAATLSDFLQERGEAAVQRYRRVRV